MIVTIFDSVILIMGIAICVFAIWGIQAPQKLAQWVIGMMEKDGAIYLAVAVRILLGLALIFAAQESRFPLVFLILGWIVIAAAFAAAFMGHERLRRLVHWWFEQFSPTGIRVWLLFAIAFGGFLIYGVA